LFELAQSFGTLSKTLTAVSEVLGTQLTTLTAITENCEQGQKQVDQLKSALLEMKSNPFALIDASSMHSILFVSSSMSLTFFFFFFFECK
jgi:hypothetical protein